MSLVTSVLGSGSTEVIGEFAAGIDDVLNTILHSDQFRAQLDQFNGVQNTCEVWRSDQWGCVRNLMATEQAVVEERSAMAVDDEADMDGVTSLEVTSVGTLPTGVGSPPVDVVPSVEMVPLVDVGIPPVGVVAPVEVTPVGTIPVGVASALDSGIPRADVVAPVEDCPAAELATPAGRTPTVAEVVQAVRRAQIVAQANAELERLTSSKCPTGLSAIAAVKLGAKIAALKRSIAVNTTPGLRTSSRRVTLPQPTTTSSITDSTVPSTTAHATTPKLVAPKVAAKPRAVVAPVVQRQPATKRVPVAGRPGVAKHEPATKACPPGGKFLGKMERLVQWEKKLGSKPLLPSTAPVVERQTCVVVSNRLCHVLSEAVTEQVPLSKNFVVRAVLTLTDEGPGEPVRRTKVRSSFAVEWLKPSWLQKKVEAKFMSGWRRNLGTVKESITNAMA